MFGDTSIVNSKTSTVLIDQESVNQRIRIGENLSLPDDSKQRVVLAAKCVRACVTQQRRPTGCDDFSTRCPSEGRIYRAIPIDIGKPICM